MKRVNTSLTKTGILFSLVLLSPGVMAAENLNFNYTRAESLSLEPRLGLQARACHSKGDPMDIHVRFNKGMNITKSYKIILDINGGVYTKSYAVFSPVVKSRASVDPDFLVPWGASAKGTAKVNEINSVLIPEIPEQNHDPFCFSNAGPKYYSIIYPPPYSFGGLIPIFKNEPYYVDPLGFLGGGDFSRRCQFALDRLSETDRNSRAYYWPYGKDLYTNRLIKYGDIQGRTGSSFIQDGIKLWGKSFLFVEKQQRIFWSYRSPAVPARTEIQATSKDYNMDENCTASNCSFTFPVGKGDHGNYIQNGGEFLVKLNNRNIMSLNLTLKYDKKTYIWKWQRDHSPWIKNRLYLTQNTTEGAIVLPTDIDNTDPYKNFYVNGFTSFYRGTLVPSSSLKMNVYTDYINKVVPLSLPPDTTGGINLVNTESLTFALGADNNGTPTLEIFGQPLKFAPLSVNGKVAASAMQIRNACY
ncbi:hypothetical protein KK671_004812 [Salmonella enterica subsp. enterica serovar Muenchen]|nr:hypothetical protein [Salmonella enterica subsp. enterica serovar Newport]EBV8523197.1 hypothetical protein [Salmonella enterica subsp. enterica serovar Larochelle]EBW7446919.1 hypothetical protein [Salmonella enterica subsp. enterica serovar Muenchen]EDC1399136.1 hypothetical protein [Salmonella enterica subsp. enterica serovar Panama]EDS8890176.1 hypothetical protein [Salmonella enterica]